MIHTSGVAEYAVVSSVREEAFGKKGAAELELVNGLHTSKSDFITLFKGTSSNFLPSGTEEDTQSDALFASLTQEKTVKSEDLASA